MCCCSVSTFVAFGSLPFLLLEEVEDFDFADGEDGSEEGGRGVDVGAGGVVEDEVASSMTFVTFFFSLLIGGSFFGEEFAAGEAFLESF